MDYKKTKYRSYTPQDYQHVNNLWLDYTEQDFSEDMIPTTGIVVEKENKVLGSIFVYTTNSNVAWLSFPLFQKGYDKSDRDELINGLIERATELSERLGYKILFTTSAQRYVLNRFVNTFDWKVGDENTTHLMKMI